MKTILKILLAAFVLSLTPTVYVCAQNPIETPAERQARLKREAAAKRKREQEAAARRRQAEETGKKKVGILFPDGSSSPQERNERLKAEQLKREEEERKRQEEAEITRQRLEVDDRNKWTHMGVFKNGLACVQDDNNKIGFIDQNRNLVIPCEWDGPIIGAAYSEGIAAVEKGHRTGFVDKTGKLVIPCQWDNAEDFSEGMACVSGNGPSYNYTQHHGYIDKSGKLVIPMQKWFSAGGFCDGLARVQKDYKKKWGFIDKTGKLVIPFKWQSVNSFSEGLALVTDSKDKNGFIDKTGTLVIPCDWDVAYSFSDGIAVVKKHHEDWKLIDKTGAIVGSIPKEWKEVNHVSDGMIRARKDSYYSTYAYFDTSGKMVIPEEWSVFSHDFHEGLAAVCKSDYWGYIDKTGTLVIPCKYKAANDFSEGLAGVKDERGAWHVIDKTGKEVRP